MTPDVHVVILAAGKGTRMKSARPKVLHPVAGIPMIEHVLDRAAGLSPQSTTIVAGHAAASLQRALGGRPGLRFAIQEPQLGTAHALLSAEPVLKDARGQLVLLSGDVPLLTAATLDELVSTHAARQAAATVVTAWVDNPHGYGRIVRNGSEIAQIVEEKDATPDERRIREINAGIYAFDLDGLFDAIRRIASDNAQREYYLPDLIAIYRRERRVVATVTAADANEIRGINSRLELAEVSRMVRQTKNADLMAAGVSLEDPATTYVDRDVQIGPDTTLHPNVSLEGQTTIGAGCEIHAGVRIVDSRLGDRVRILNHCVITGATIDDDASVGPFAHLRTGAIVRVRAKVGNFVEMKNTELGPDSKTMHLTYLGDAVIGANVNVGAGTITCNYDGTAKRTTTIEDGAFIGSDSQLVAPVTVGRDAYVGTGTTIREDVPAGALAVSAGTQRNIEGWVDRKGRRKANAKS